MSAAVTSACVIVAGWVTGYLLVILPDRLARRRRPSEHHALVERAVFGPVQMYAVHCPACASACTCRNPSRLHIIGASRTETGARSIVLDHQLETQETR